MGLQEGHPPTVDDHVEEGHRAVVVHHRLGDDDREHHGGQEAGASRGLEEDRGDGHSHAREAPQTRGHAHQRVHAGVGRRGVVVLIGEEPSHAPHDAAGDHQRDEEAVGRLDADDHAREEEEDQQKNK